MYTKEYEFNTYDEAVFAKNELLNSLSAQAFRVIICEILTRSGKFYLYVRYY